MEEQVRAGFTVGKGHGVVLFGQKEVQGRRTGINSRKDTYFRIIVGEFLDSSIGINIGKEGVGGQIA